MNEVFHDPAEAAAWCRTLTGTLGFVPTMGALHEGHLELVRRSVGENETTCVSVFVNPLQFNNPADLEHYPRDFDRDAELLAEAGCGMVFTGTPELFFPEVASLEDVPRRDPGPGARGLEGESRPGHFAGVATIVARLFELVRPTRTYFGEKDFQQTLVVRELARSLPGLEVVVCPTSRESSGLARASRNALITDVDRPHAVAVSRALFRARELWGEGERAPHALAEAMRAELERDGLVVEYAAVRDPEAWTAEEPRGPLPRGQALIAAKLGAVRLIDNLRLDDPA